MLHICKFIFSITIGTIYLSKGERFIMKTGERIKTIRKSQGITQAKLAETLHISSSFMSRIENGSSSLTLDFVCEIADALQVTRQILQFFPVHSAAFPLLFLSHLNLYTLSLQQKHTRLHNCLRLPHLPQHLPAVNSKI